MSNVRSFIGGKTPADKESSVKILESMLEDFKSGTIIAFSAVGVMTNDASMFYSAHTADSFTQLKQIGACASLLNHVINRNDNEP